MHCLLLHNICNATLLLDHLILKYCNFSLLSTIEVYLKVDRYDLKAAFVCSDFAIDPISLDL